LIDYVEELSSEEEVDGKSYSTKEVSTALSGMLSRLKDDSKKTPNAGKWFNKQKVLLLCSRGAPSIHRLLLNDLKSLLPHHKSEPKFGK
jgi:ribosome biogenesis protein BRX1